MEIVASLWSQQRAKRHSCTLVSLKKRRTPHNWYECVSALAKCMLCLLCMCAWNGHACVFACMQACKCMFVCACAGACLHLCACRQTSCFEKSVPTSGVLMCFCLGFGTL